MQEKLKKYVVLFLSTFQLSAFTFGGGFVIIPLIRKKFVEQLGWIGEEEMLDLAAIAQSSPGAIAVNISILVGYRVAGVPGALLTVVGTMTPPLIVISVISLFYAAFRDNVFVNMAMCGMLAGVAAVILMWCCGWRRTSSARSGCCRWPSWRALCGQPLFEREHHHNYPGVRRLWCAGSCAPAAQCKGGGIMIFAQLFWSFFQIGLFSIGGGYAAMPLIQQQVVDQHAWLTMNQFADIMTIAEMPPVPSPSTRPPLWASGWRGCPAPSWPPPGACCPPASLC